MTKRIIGLVLALCLVVGLLPMVAWAEDHVHTPGEATILNQNNAAVVKNSSTYNHTAGSYEVEYTCTECGVTYPETISFGALMLKYINDSTFTKEETGTTTLGSYSNWTNTGNNANMYRPDVVMNPGDEPIYFVTTNSHKTFTTNYYVSKLTDEAKIAAGEWNMKLEYPVLGNPKVTMKNAKIINNFGLWFGPAAFSTTAHIEVVLEGENIIKSDVSRNRDRENVNSPLLSFWTTGGVTFTGSGKLTVANHQYATNGIIHSNSSITFKDTNVDIVKLDNYSSAASCYGISAKNGSSDIIIDSSKINLFCYCPEITSSDDGIGVYNASYHGLAYGILGNNITIKNHSNVNVTASLAGRNTTSSYGIYAKGNLAIDNSDLLVSHGGYSYGQAIGSKTYTVNFDNGFILETSGSKFSYSTLTGKVTYPTVTPTVCTTASDIPTNVLNLYQNKTGYKDKPYYVRIAPATHTHQDDNVTIKTILPADYAPCAQYKYEVKICNVCGLELSRTQIALEGTPTAEHTPGSKVYSSMTSATYAKAGSYNYTIYCSICNESMGTVNDPVGSAYLQFSGKETTARVTDRSTWFTTLNSSIGSANYLYPGKSTLYYTVQSYDDAFSTTDTYIRKLDSSVTADKAIINSKTNLISLSYGMFGTPTLTLYGVDLTNCTGLWYALGKNTTIAPLKVVVSKDSTISHPADTIAPALGFQTTGDVTISGPGKLTINSRTIGDAAIIRSLGNLIFDNANVEINRVADAETTACPIQSVGGDVIIRNNSTINIQGFDKAKAAFSNGIDAQAKNNKGGNIVIDSSTVTVLGTLNGAVDPDSAMLQADGNVTIVNSAVTLGHGYKMDANSQEVNTLTGKAVNIGGQFTVSNAVIDAKTAATNTVYDVTGETPNIVVPAETTVYTKPEDLTANILSNQYLSIATVETLVEFDGTRAGLEDSLLLEFALDITKVDPSCYAKIVRTRINDDGTTTVDEPIKVYLSEVSTEGDYYVIPYFGIAAKEMQDTISVTVYNTNDVAVTKTVSDSIYTYAMRFLRNAMPSTISAKDFRKLKVTLTTMLNYGAMAQIEFKHNVANLVNADLYNGNGNFQHTHTATGFRAPTEMNADDLAFDFYKLQLSNRVEAFPAKPATVQTNGDVTVKHLGTTFELNTNIAMLIAVTGNATSAKVYVDGVESQEGAVITAGDGYSIITFNGLNAADGRKEVKFEVYNGETLTVTVTDSLVAYVGRNVENYPYLKNLLQYCDAAATYFATK